MDEETKKSEIPQFIKQKITQYEEKNGQNRFREHFAIADTKELQPSKNNNLLHLMMNRVCITTTEKQFDNIMAAVEEIINIVPSNIFKKTNSEKLTPIELARKQLSTIIKSLEKTEKTTKEDLEEAKRVEKVKDLINEIEKKIEEKKQWKEGLKKEIGPKEKIKNPFPPQKQEKIYPRPTSPKTSPQKTAGAYPTGKAPWEQGRT